MNIFTFHEPDGPVYWGVCAKCGMKVGPSDRAEDVGRPCELCALMFLQFKQNQQFSLSIAKAAADGVRFEGVL